MTNIVIYARYSSDNQRQESIEAQLHAIHKFCKDNNFNVIKTYIDEEVSATTDDRESFLEMISDSSKLQYDYVVVHKLDRFARNRYDSAINKKVLERNGKKVLSVLERLDDSPESIMLESVLEGMAEYYSVNLAREVKKGMELNARKGIHTGGKPPYGYDVVDGRYIANESEAKIVQAIFQMYDRGEGLRTITAKLADMGIENKHGRNFEHTSIYYLLRNKKYIGIYEYQPTPKGKKRSNYHNFENRIIIENNHESIIDTKLWNSVQNRIGEVKPRMSKNEKNYYLTGTIICGHCGSNYHGGGWDGKRYVYVCSNSRKGCKNKKINAIKLESYVIDKIRETYLTESMIALVSKQAKEIIEESQLNSKKEEKNIRLKIDDTDSKINSLFDFYLDGGMDKDILKEQSNRLKAEREKLINRLSVIESSSAIIDFEIMYDMLNTMKKTTIDSDPKDIALIIKMFVNKIIIGDNNGDNITIKLYSVTEIVGGSVESASPAPIYKFKEWHLSFFFYHYTMNRI